MNQAIRKTAVVAMTTILVGWGCGGGSSTPSVSGSDAESTVTGTVMLKGKPITRGTLIFDPANIARKDAKARIAEVGKDGKYTVKTLVGENMVTLSGQNLPPYRQLYNVKDGSDTISFDAYPQ